MENAKRDVCEANRVETERAYELYLVQSGKIDNDSNFNAFLDQYD